MERQVEMVNAEARVSRELANFALIRNKTNCFHARTQTSTFPAIICVLFIENILHTFIIQLSGGLFI